MTWERGHFQTVLGRLLLGPVQAVQWQQKQWDSQLHACLEWEVLCTD